MTELGLIGWLVMCCERIINGRGGITYNKDDFISFPQKEISFFDGFLKGLNSELAPLPLCHGRRKKTSMHPTSGFAEGSGGLYGYPALSSDFFIGESIATLSWTSEKKSLPPA